nr:MAG TPA: hypothetical protein [Caudoviricetes sp.]
MEQVFAIFVENLIIITCQGNLLIFRLAKIGEWKISKLVK